MMIHLGLAVVAIALGLAVHSAATIAATLLAGAVWLAIGRRAAFVVLALTLAAAFFGLRVDAFGPAPDTNALRDAR